MVAIDSRAIAIDAHTIDATVVVDDARAIDAAVRTNDAGANDARAIDAAVLSIDARVTTPDAAAAVDARVTAPDARVAAPDARVSTPDARAPTPDAAILPPDAHVDLAPVASAQSVTVDENASTSITLGATDVDTEANLLSYAVVTQPTHGALTGTAPNMTYKPTADFHGSDSFTFKSNDGSLDSNSATVSITVTHVNQAPVAAAQSIELDEDSELNVTLAATDVDGDLLTYAIVDAPTNGSLSGIPPDVTYTPAANVHGADSFSFTANDGVLDSNIATISIIVDHVNQAPVATPQNDSVNENSSMGIALAGTDADSDALTFAVVAQPTHGALTGTAPNLTYTPASNFHGADSFTFKANDGVLDSAAATVSITVTHVNQAPVASSQSASVDENSEVNVTLGASDVDNDTLTFAVVGAPTNGSLSGIPPDLTYTPAENFHGSDSFTFKANDGALDSNVATVSITVNHINQAPVATPQNVSVNENSATAITLAGTDVDNDTLTFVVVSQPSNGQLTGSAPNLTYTPSANFHGSDSFTFKANDGALDSSVATVSITVNHVNQAPVSTGQSLSVNEGMPLTVTLAATDVDGDSLTFAVVTSPTNGIVTGTAPNLIYTPNANYFGADNFTFKANDGVLDSNVSTISITVNQYNTVGLTNTLAGGAQHACAIINGGVQCWGKNTSGQLGNNSTTNSSVPVAVAGITSGVEAIGAGQNFTCALVNGGVQCWGANANGELGNGTTTSSLVPVAVTGMTSGVQSIAVGAGFACAMVNGGISCWGANGLGQLGNGLTSDSSVPVAVTGLASGVFAIASGSLANHVCAIVAGGVQCWGDNTNGDLGNNSTTQSSVPVAVANLTSGVQAIAVGTAHSCARNNGSVQCWGNNSNGQLGNNTSTASSIPVAVTGLTTGVQAIAAANNQSCAMVNGSAQCWGQNNFGQLGNSSTTDSLVPVLVTGLSGGVQAITGGGASFYALVNGGVQSWGSNLSGQLGNNTTTDSSVPVQVTGIVSGVEQIAEGGQFSCALISGGVQCWGAAGTGQLGNNSIVTSHVPVQVLGMTSGVQSISANGGTACAVQNGAAWCWGTNTNGQLGNNSVTNSLVPVQVTGLTSGVQSVSVGGFHACAIVNGGVQCWGFGTHGQLGNCTSSSSLVPVTVVTTGNNCATTTTLSGATALVTGANHTCVQVDGGVLCTGLSTAIGDGSTFNSVAPGGVIGLDPATKSGVQAIAGTSNSTCALANGGVQCWGLNTSGQLGNGTISSSSSVPVQVTGLTSGVRLIGANNNNSCATVDSGAFCWGANASGQLGNNTVVASSLPVAVLGLSSAIQLFSIGGVHMGAVVNGAVVNWGDNTNGQLGDNTTTNRLEPTAMVPWAP